MTNKERKLLGKDLCARLPYHCQVFYEYVDDLDNKTYGYSLTLNTWCINQFINNKAVVKPYLRPMKSMVEEEMAEYAALQDRFLLSSQYPVTGAYEMFDWLNAHHFDYRGLIDNGLALEVPTGMYD